MVFPVSPLLADRMNLSDSGSCVTGHFQHPHERPWKYVDRPLTPLLAKLLGAKESEVAHTSTLTSNLHNLFTSFYRPTQKRWKIVIEKGSFPSDWVSCAWPRKMAGRLMISQYAVHSHPRLWDAVLSKEQIDNAIIPLEPREGEETLRTEDILKTLDEHKDEVSPLSTNIMGRRLIGQIAVVWLPIVQYYTGQLFDIVPISKKTHGIGALLGLDLAHGSGNVTVKLNEWNVDFAVWCTYKWVAQVTWLRMRSHQSGTSMPGRAPLVACTSGKVWMTEAGGV